ncbi:MAG: hypothetical protein GX466_09025 [Candidatus Cloacimonetes bacterium]|nr:hypothetical protein [Candidatus Cloacimonadota bacterium]
MDPNNDHWDAGFKAGAASKAWRIADLEAKLKQYETGQTVPLVDYQCVTKQIVMLRATITTQADAIVRLVAMRNK